MYSEKYGKYGSGGAYSYGSYKSKVINKGDLHRRKALGKGSKPPEGWYESDELVSVIPGTSFVPTKTPLSNHFSVKKKYGPMDVVHIAKEKLDVDIGCFIDLTNTDKFYSSKDIEGDIIHDKLPLRGHDKYPTEREIQSFLMFVQKFEKLHPDKHIAIHCTHGQNRTGFMLCTYLIRKCNKTVNEALKIFKEYRPPGLYNPVLICGLYITNNELSSDGFYNMKKPVFPSYSHPRKVSLKWNLALKIISKHAIPSAESESKLDFPNKKAERIIFKKSKKEKSKHTNISQELATQIVEGVENYEAKDEKEMTKKMKKKARSAKAKERKSKKRLISEVEPDREENDDLEKKEQNLVEKPSKKMKKEKRKLAKEEEKKKKKQIHLMRKSKKKRKKLKQKEKKKK